MNDILINLVNVSKEIEHKYVLKDINLTIERGKSYGVVGEIKSGKTMLLRAVVGLTYITSGEIIKSNNLKLGAFLEAPGFLPEYTGFSNLKLLSGIQGKISDNEIRDAMLRSGLDYNESKKVKDFSADMLHKLAIAQAIMSCPDLLVLDEPTAELDRESTKNIRKLMLQEKQRETAILISSQSIEEIDFLCDYVYKIENGKLEFITQNN